MISSDLRNLRSWLTNLAKTERLTPDLFLEGMTQLEVLANDVEELELHAMPPSARLQGNETNVVLLSTRRDRKRGDGRGQDGGGQGRHA